MERRILAELFVEDEKAIKMDKEIISYAKGVIDYQCQECGISTGQMRILDDDDPEDAKTRDLADKIFNSKENKPTKVWVVEEQSVYDTVNEPRDVHIFSTYEKAKEFFDKYVASEKENDHLMDLDDKVLEESENHFAIWQDGCYCEDHYEINIVERVVR